MAANQVPSKSETKPAYDTTKPTAEEDKPSIQDVVDYVLESGVDISDLMAELDRVLVAEDTIKQIIVADLKGEELAKDKEEFDKKVEEAIKKYREEQKKKREEEEAAAKAEAKKESAKESK